MFMPNSLIMPEREKGASEEVEVIPASWSEFIVRVGSWTSGSEMASMSGRLKQEDVRHG